MNILVTGGAGYIGSHTVRLLEKTGGKVVVYDNLVTGHKEAIKNSLFVEGDIFDSEKLTDTLKRFDISSVVHFAAYSLVGVSMVNPREYYHNNVVGTLNLLDVMLANGVNKLVFSSTAAVYGEPETSLITEEIAKNPTNVYGRTKLIMENVMADYSRTYGLNYIALRYFNACGADVAGDIGEDHQPETHLIPLVLKACLGKTDKLKIFGEDYPTTDGTCVRDYIHVNDLGQAHVLALKALYNGHGSAVYNLGNGNGFTVKEVIEAAEAVTGLTVPKEIAPRRAGDPAILVAGSQKIRQELGWQPEYTDINKIIETAWHWHQQNPDGFAG
ncbi:UDP-glucose 4-epimerase [Sporomusa rhizae]|uniref:UDP-glucose 4-epimerase GalE n=1 Tax=Sporomusa rhizae TaxID=357999 RepID=UPI00352B14AD